MWKDDNFWHYGHVKTLLKTSAEKIENWDYNAVITILTHKHRLGKDFRRHITEFSRLRILISGGGCNKNDLDENWLVVETTMYYRLQMTRNCG